MAYKPLSQTVDDDDIFANPSSEAVFELVKVKADDDLGNLSITGVEGQVLTLGASGPYWDDAASGGGGSAEYPPQEGNAGKFLQTDGSDVSWQAVTGFEPTVSLTTDRVVVSNASGKLAVSSVTPTTLGYLDVGSSVTGLLAEKANVALSNLSGTTAINQTLLFQTDDTYDIGASADFRPANVYATQSLQVPRVHAVDGVGSAFHDLLVRGGDGITGNHDGGDVTVRGGNKNGSGTDGEILLQTAESTRLKIGATGNIQASGITASRALVTDASSNLSASETTNTELGYLSGVTSAVQTQLNARLPITTASGTTTNATVTTLQTIATSSNTTNGLEVRVAARRTGGTAGATGDAAFYVLKAMAKNISGTVTLSTVEAVEFEDQSSWDADLVASGTNVLVRITGATNNNISWSATTINITV